MQPDIRQTNHLNPDQIEQLNKQLRNHDRDTVTGTIELGGEGEKQEKIDLVIERGVFGSDIMSSGIYLAQYLYDKKEIYSGKNALDLGCGPGTQGIIMAKYGAEKVDLSDLNPKAAENTKKNVKKHGLEERCRVFSGDLFVALPPDEQYDIIVFNHPFFPEEAGNFKSNHTDDEMLKKTMLGGQELIKRFFSEAKKHLKEGGKIIMPYFHLAGPENDPANHVEKYGFIIENEEKVLSENGIQLGDFSIYTIRALDDSRN